MAVDGRTGVAHPVAAAGVRVGAEVVPLRVRLDSIDLVRGLVMVIMALDHARDFFSIVHFDPGDYPISTWAALPAASWKALFLTRWVTHFCAPVFVFLAGTSAFLSGSRGKTKGELSRFLLTRGLWLVLLELTVVRFAWLFDLNYHFVFVQVIWAIGWSMVVLSALVFLPVAVVAAFGVVMIVTHNLFDAVKPEGFGSLSWLWTVLHVSTSLEPAPGYSFFVGYPLIPWIGVMAAGYGFGTLYRLDSGRRRAALIALGSAVTAAFVAIRTLDGYGEPIPWTGQSELSATLLSFLDTTKYPPSLLYLLMTLGPAILLLGLLERHAAPRRGLSRVMITFGRVPLFFYVAHLFLIHTAAAVYAVGKYGAKAVQIDPLHIPADYGFELPGVYLAWLLALFVLYWPCRWFASVKQRRRDPWLSYL